MGSVDFSSVLQPANDFSTRVAEVERWICAIDTGVGTRGTGVLVGPDLVLTNYHVIERLLPQAGATSIARCRFDFKTIPDTDKHLPGRWVDFAAGWCVMQSLPSAADRQGTHTGFKGDELDYAIVRLAENVGEQPVDLPDEQVPLRGWLPIPENAALPKPGATIFVYQHPVKLGGQEAMPQQSSDGAVIEYLDRNLRMRYNATTLKGSSGAAVFDSKFQFVALHNSGDKTEDIADQGKWNQAIPLPAIVNHLRLCGQGALIGRRPPPRVTASPVIDLAARTRELAEDIVQQRLWAASILMDRDKVEDRVNWTRHNRDGNRGMVHVLACRQVDSHQNFLKRLSIVTVDEQLEAKERRRLAFLGAGSGEPAWREMTLEWHADEDEAVALDMISGKLKEFAELQGRTLVTATVGVDAIKIAREKRVVKAVAALCRTISDADRLQLFVVYHDPEDKQPARRKELGALWELGNRPTGCGVCACLEDVGSDELSAWCNALQAAWRVPGGKLPSAVKAVFAGKPKLPIVDIETGMEPNLRLLIAALR